METLNSISSVNIPQLALIGAVVAAFATGWNHIKGFFGLLSRMIFVESNIDYNMEAIINAYMVNKAKRFTFGFRSFGIIQTFGRDNKIKNFAYEYTMTQKALFFLGWRPMTYKRSDHGGSSLRYFRWTVNIENLTKEATEFYNDLEKGKEKLRNRFQIIRRHGKGSIHSRMNITMPTDEDSPEAGLRTTSDPFRMVLMGSYKPIGFDINDIGSFGGTDILDTFSFSEKSNELIEHIKNWYKSEKWFSTHNLPWRMGVLLYGNPGSGKSTLITGIGQKYDLPIISLDISSMSNEEFEKFYEEAAMLTPSIVLIEDIDRVFHGDINITEERGGGLTMDCILNTISGVSPKDGVITFITANNKELVTPAIAKLADDGTPSRPGRVDWIVEVGDMDDKSKSFLVDKMLDFLSDEEKEEIIGMENLKTPAQFTNHCKNIALSYFKEQNKTLD